MGGGPGERPGPGQLDWTSPAPQLLTTQPISGLSVTQKLASL